MEHRNRVFWSAETVWMVEGEIGCDEMGETQSGSTVSMELTHVRKTFVGTWEGGNRSRWRTIRSSLTGT